MPTAAEQIKKVVNSVEKCLRRFRVAATAPARYSPDQAKRCDMNIQTADEGYHYGVIRRAIELYDGQGARGQ